MADVLFSTKHIWRVACEDMPTDGITTIGGIANTDPTLLHDWFGKWGYVLHTFANGWDTAPVVRAGDEAIIKSVGNSTTTPRDICNLQEAKIVFYNLAESVTVGHYSIARAVMSTDPTLRQFDTKGDHTILPVGYIA